MLKKHIIGVVGGVGPYAGLDLVKKIFDQTTASIDQEHLPVILMSLPDEIEDRTKFLVGTSAANPAHSIVEILQKLETVGATVAGIPCNTAHAPRIFDVVRQGIEQQGLLIRLLHMIDETVLFVQQNFPTLKNIGLLSTTGTAQSGIYQRSFERGGVRIILPSDEVQQKKVHSAIYDSGNGIKAFSNPVTDQARQSLLEAIDWLRNRGAEAVILGCTEIPLAVPEKLIDTMPLIDPTMILSRSLISLTYPSKLKQFQPI